MRYALLGAVALTALLSACDDGSEEECAEGYVLTSTGCRFLNTDGGVPFDAGNAVDATTAALGDSSFDSGRDTGTDAGPCPMGCEEETPYCDTAANRCVECLPNQLCADPSAARCLDGECVACSVDAHCSHLTGANVCDADAGRCVECTVQDESACGSNSCDPATRRCTNTVIASVQTCGACVADSECRDSEDRCVPMSFQDSARDGGYCLRMVVDEMPCERPFSVPTGERTSLSGETGVYCGLSEALTTCEAVLAHLTDQACTDDSDCGAVDLDDGVCTTVEGRPNRCSYLCGTAARCPQSFTCNNLYCGT